MSEIARTEEALRNADKAGDVEAAKALAGHLKSLYTSRAVPLDKALDRSTGAPFYVREAVGSAPPQDRLATIRQNYPDAQPYEGDNFVFSDPKTGRPTLYNEENPRILGVPVPTVGDAASVAREATQSVGATLGAVGGAFAAGPPGAVVGAGAGTVAGGNLYDAIRTGIRGKPDTRTVGQVMGDSAVDFAAGAAGERIGQAIPGAIKGIVSGTKNRMAGVTASELDDAARTVGVNLTAGQATGNRAMQGLEAAAGRLPTGAQRMQTFVAKQLDDLAAASDDLARGYGGASTDVEAGRAINRGVTGFVERFREQGATLYGKLDRIIGMKTPVKPQRTLAALTGQGDALEGAPNLGAVLQNPKLKTFADALTKDAEATGGTVRYETLKALRSRVGEMLSDPVLINDVPRRELSRVYAAISDDMRSAAPTPYAARQFDRANAYWSAGMKRIEDSLSKIVNEAVPEQAYKAAISGGRDGATRILALRRSLQPDEWGTVAGRLLRDMGTPNAGQTSAEALPQFSPAKFLTEWAKLRENGATEAIFRGTPYQSLAPKLDALVKVSGAVKDSAAMANPSGTASQTVFMQVLQGGLMGAGGGAAVGAPTAGAVAGIALPYGAARLLTNERFVGWLVKASQIPPTDTSGVMAHLSRLVPIAQANDPETRQAIQQYYGSVMELLGSQERPEPPIR